MKSLNVDQVKKYNIDTLIDFNEDMAKKSAESINGVCQIYNNRPNKEITLSMDNINAMGKGHYEFMKDVWYKILDEQYKRLNVGYDHTVFLDPKTYHGLTDMDRFARGLAKSNGYGDFESLVNEMKKKGGMNNVYTPDILFDKYLKFNEQGDLEPAITEEQLSEEFTIRVHDKDGKELLKLLRQIKAQLSKHGIYYIPSYLFDYKDSDKEVFSNLDFDIVLGQWKEAKK
jgi:hypothetical protein